MSRCRLRRRPRRRTPGPSRRHRDRDRSRATGNIEAARLHAEAAGLTIDYRATTAEDLAATGATFDLVTCLEVIEHVPDQKAFVATIAGLLKPGGLVVFSTLNRTPKSYALAIVGAEYVLGWVPRGTHDWQNSSRSAN